VSAAILSAATLLVVAKSPVPGEAKTRLTALLSPEQAADLAAAALLDTLAAVSATPSGCRVVALTGDLAHAQRRPELQEALGNFLVVRQRGVAFAERLVAAHHDAAEAGGAGGGVLQVGMDTPQLTPGMLAGAAAQLSSRHTDAVLGPASDGGWWALGVRRPELADVLREVPMSRSDTGALTLAALRRGSARVHLLEELNDVDTPADIRAVANAAPGTLFADAAARVDTGAVGPVAGRTQSRRPLSRPA